MRDYLVWDIDEQDERDAIRVAANTPKLAAEKACRKMNDRAVEFPPERRLRVKKQNVTDDFTVELRAEPVYTAKRTEGAGNG